MRTRKLELLRPEEILDEMRRCPVVYLPLAPLEWHGPHLPYGVDPLIASALAVRLADRLGGLVHPYLPLGSERERDAVTLKNLGFDGGEWIVGMDFPANSLPSLYLPEEVLAIVVRHQIVLLARMGFRHVVLVNGHGGRNHVAALKRIAAEALGRRPLSGPLRLHVPRGRGHLVAAPSRRDRRDGGDDPPPSGDGANGGATAAGPADPGEGFCRGGRRRLLGQDASGGHPHGGSPDRDGRAGRGPFGRVG